MSNRKSRRPCSRSVGVVTLPSLEIGERDAASAVTAAGLVPLTSALAVKRSSGSQRLSGTSDARYDTRPDFARPCGASAVSRFVHVITGTIALNATPATVAFQT